MCNNHIQSNPISSYDHILLSRINYHTVGPTFSLRYCSLWERWWFLGQQLWPMGQIWPTSKSHQIHLCVQSSAWEEKPLALVTRYPTENDRDACLGLRSPCDPGRNRHHSLSSVQRLGWEASLPKPSTTWTISGSMATLKFSGDVTAKCLAL